MGLPEHPFVTMQEAADEMGKSIDYVKRCILNGDLAGYVNLKPAVGVYRKISSYQRIILKWDQWRSFWEKDTICFPAIDVFDPDENEVIEQVPSNYSASISDVMVKTTDIKALLGQNPQEEPKEPPEKYAARRRTELIGPPIYRQRVIASELKEYYPHLQAGQIQEIIEPARYNKGQDEARRKQGERRIKEGNKLRNK